MEFFIWWGIMGIIVSSIVTTIQLYRFPWADVSLVGFLISIVVWPIYLFAFIIQFIREGW